MLKTRMQNVFESIMQSFDQASGAMDRMTDSTGALDEAYSTYLDSIQGRTAQLTATFQSMSQNIVNSDIMKAVIQFITDLVEGLTTLMTVGDGFIAKAILIYTAWQAWAILLPKILSLLPTLITLIKSLSVSTLIATTSQVGFLNAIVETEATGLAGMITLIPKLIMALYLYSAGIVSAKYKTISFGEALELVNLNPLMLAITALVAAIAGLSYAMYSVSGAAKTKVLEESAEKVSGLESDLKSLNDELKTTQTRMAAVQNKKGGLSAVEQKELKRLQQYNAELTTNINLTKQQLEIAQRENEKNFVQAVQADKDDLAWYERLLNLLLGATSLVAGGETTALGGAISVLNKGFADGATASAEFEKNLQQYEDLKKRLSSSEGTFDERSEWEQQQQTLASGMNSYIKTLQDAYNSLGEFDYSELSESAKQQVDYYFDTMYRYMISAAKPEELSDKLDDIISSVYNSDRFEKAREAIQSLPSLTDDAIKELMSSNDDVKAFVQNLINIGAIDFDWTTGQFDGLADVLDRVEHQAVDADSAADAAAAQFDELKTNVDDLKDAYSKVSSAIEEFNTYGALSADTIKDLISLKPEYLNLLMDENGQLNLTSESYTELYRAKLRDMLVSQVKTTLNNILAMGEEEAAAYALANAYDTETDSLEALVEAEFRSAYASAAAKDAANNTTVYTDAVTRYATIVPTLMSLVNSAQIDAAESTNVATDALNAQKDALEDEKDALEDQKDALEDQKDALEDLKDEWEDYKDDLSDAKDKIQDLIDVTVDYIKQTKEDEKEAISERKDAFDELIEKEKEELEVKKEAADFADTLREKENAVAKNALSAAIASLDDSGAGQKARKQAEDDLAESRADLYSELADHEYDVRVAALEDLQEYFDEYYDSETEKIETYLDDERQIYNDACAMIENDTGDLYAKLWQYTYEHTTKTRAEFDNMWNSAQAAMEEYNVAQYGVIGVMEFLNSEIYGCEAQIAALDSQIDILDGNIDILDQSIDELDERIDSVSESIEALADNSIDKLTTSIGNLKKELASLGNDYVSNDTDNSGSNMVAGLPNAGSAVVNTASKLRAVPISQAPTITQTVFKTNYGYTDGKGKSVTLYSDGRGNYYLDSAHKRPVKIVNLASGKLENAFKRTHFASGTMSAPGGVSEVNENGHEIRILNKGDGILTAKITKNLARLGADPAGVLADAGKQLLKSLSNVALRDDVASKLYNSVYGVSPNSSQPITVVNHIQGDVNPSTLKALVSAQKQITRNAVSEMMRKTTQLRYNTAVY